MTNNYIAIYSIALNSDFIYTKKTILEIFASVLDDKNEESFAFFEYDQDADQVVIKIMREDDENNY